MLEEMVKAIIKKYLATDCPHLKLPAVVYASVQSVKKLDAYDIGELVIHAYDDGGSSFRGHITANWYEYTLTVLDKFGNADKNYPVLPGIKSKSQFKAGAVVAIALPFGELEPTIIGEVSL